MDYIKRGVIRELSEEEIQEWDGGQNYISHHDVTKPGFRTTKLQIVSNSCLNNNGKGLSYNDTLLKGPNSLSSLYSALITFHFYECVVVWDLQKAYNAISTTLVECHYRRMVWRYGDASQDWTTFGFMKMTFGDRPAGFALEDAKQMVYEAGKSICLKTADIMSHGSYVDDSSGGGTTEDVDYLICKVSVNNDGMYSYNGTVAQKLS